MLLRRQLIGMLWVDSREVARAHLVFLSINRTDSTFVVDVFQQTAVFHLPLRTTMEYLSFFLKLNDGDGFVHLRCQTLIFVFHRVAFQQFWHEFLAGVVAIDFHCKGCQRYEIDTVCLLDGRQIGIAQ